MDNLEIIAKASGQKPNDLRWTELAIYHDPSPADPGQAFTAEIVGESKMPGEVRRERRAKFDSVLAALAWGSFNAKSDLFAQLRQQSTAWLEKRVLARPLRRSIQDHAVDILRDLVAAANADDDDRIDQAIMDATAFLKELDDGPSFVR